MRTRAAASSPIHRPSFRRVRCAVVVHSCDAEGLARTDGAGGKFRPILGAAKLDAARSCHFLES